MKRIVITKYEKKYIAIFLDNDKPVKIRAFTGLDEFSDTVFAGYIKDVKPSMNASFVKLNDDKTGYLEGCKYKSGSIIPVCITKETISKKDDVVSDKISLTGVFTIVSNSFSGIRFSKNLSNDLKNIITEYLEPLDLNSGFGIIVRSNAKYASKVSLINELSYLIKQLTEVLEKAEYRTYGSVLYKGMSSLIEFLFSEDLNEFNQIITDIDEVYLHVTDFISENSNNNVDVCMKIEKYEDDYSLASLISLRKIIEYATNKVVYLKSGAHIVIEHTEALTAIDVNTGTTLLKGTKEEIIHKVNIEAAEEIINQIKLRNLSGIIIVDFINQRSKDLNFELIDNIAAFINKYDRTIKCHGMTELGLVELSRKRDKKPFREQLWK